MITNVINYYVYMYILYIYKYKIYRNLSLDKHKPLVIKDKTRKNIHT